MPTFALPKFSQLAHLGVLKFIVAPAEGEGSSATDETSNTDGVVETSADADGGDESDNTGGEPLGEGGKKALEDERAKRKAAEKAVAELRRQLAASRPADIADVNARLIELEAANAAKDLDIARLGLVAAHGLDDEAATALKDLADVAAMEKFAALLAKKTPALTNNRQERHPGFGGGGKLSGLAAGREAARAEKKKI